MNKKLLTAAVGAALVAGPMYAAQADVKVYGQVQAEVASIDASDFQVDPTVLAPGLTVKGTGFDGITEEDRNRGRAGIFATEDLGGGLKGIAKVEWKLDTTQGGAPNGNREAFVGLQGNWGTFMAGSLKSPYKYTGGAAYDPFIASTLEARGNGGMTGDELRMFGVSNAFGHNGFLSDMLGYTSPKMGGFQFWVVYSPDENSGASPGSVNLASSSAVRSANGTTTANTGSKGDMSAAATFGAKDWEVFVKYIKNDVIGGQVQADDATKGSYSSTSIGGKIKLGAFTILGQAEQGKFKDVMINAGDFYRRYIDRDGSTFDCTGALCVGTGDEDLDTYYVGADFQFGNNTVHARVAEQKWDNFDETVSYTLLGITHKFSKTTRVFAGYRQTEFDEYDGKVKVMSVGMRKDF